MRYVAIAVLLAIAPGTASADEAKVRAEIKEIYTFSPHELSSEQIKEKSAILDTFWAQTKALQHIYLPVLRAELAVPGARPFFYYNGSMLLLSLSDTAADRKLAISAIARADLKDLQHTHYMRQVHRFATQGEDTTELALRVLDVPDFKAFIAQHALTLGQDYSLVYMLLPVEPSLWQARVLQRLTTERDAKAQRSLLLLAWYLQTPEADAALDAFSADASKSGELREYAQELRSRPAGVAGFIGKAVAAFTSIEELRAERREVMKRVSDEALIELDQLTLKIAAKRR